MPSFTANGVPGVRQWRSEQLDLWAIAVSGSAFLLVMGDADAWLSALVCLLAAVLHGLRLAGWNPWATRHAPMLWILHLSYAWIPLSLLLLAASRVGYVAPSAAIHALTIGAVGGLIIGMVTRTALGHTGRPVRAGRIEHLVFVLMPLAAISRVAPYLIEALPYRAMFSISALFWSLAFVLYLVKYGPLLCRPRADGREG